MTKLNSDMHPKLSDNIIQQLQRKNISTIIEFVLEDSEKLVTVTGLLHKDVLELKRNISERYGGRVKNASDLLEIEQRNIVSTNITSLDNLLKGGLHPGQIYELCGISSSGKSQLCLSIAANVAIQANNLVRYIDTKRDFCGSRVEQILMNKNCGKEVIDETLERIKVCYVHSLRELFRVLRCLKNALHTEAEELRTRIIIIDSLPAIIFKFSKDHQTTYALNHLANICRFIANEFHLSIISVNLITQWNANAENKASTSANGNQNNVVPTLGKYWLHVPNTRLFIERVGSENRRVTVWKSFQLERNVTCSLNISNAGVT